jgi:hypothetical protein
MRTLGFLLAAIVALVVGPVWLLASGAQTSKLTLKIDATGTKSNDQGTASDPIALDWTQLFSSGTGANQASNVFHDTRTISASSSENLDLAGSLTNAFGDTLTFTKIKAIAIHADAGNTNDVQVGGAASNAFNTWVGDDTDIVAVKPGGTLILVAPNSSGYAVTADTGDILKVANSSSGTSVTYTVVILGVD